MRWWRTAAATLLLLPGGIVVGAPAASAAADQAPPVLVGITVSPDAVSVSGVDLVPVTVSAHLTDETGVERSGEMDGSNLPAVTLQRAGGGEDSTQGVELALTSGTPQDGTWSATVQVPSTWDGEWRVSRLVAVDGASNRLDVAPSTDSKLTVTGTHKPAVTMRFVPDPLVGDGPLTVEGRFYYQDTGKGIGDQPIYFGQDNLCVEYPSPPNGTTRADGTFSRVYPKGLGVLHCVGILRPSNVSIAPSFIVGTGNFPRVRPAVTIKASSTTVAPGKKVTFTGAVKPAGSSGYRVELQQLRDGTWRKVTGASIDVTYTLSTRPTTPGSVRYRVVTLNDDPALMGVSETVTVRVVAGGATPPGAGSGGGSGTLPITGPAVPSLVGGAAALLFVGAGLMLLARRRHDVTPADGPA
ncbi:hypothetical protein ACIA5A_02895 [Micromonospora sp. NPDC051300]|uniref:hypothetical protein n=1 Tax=Micromonospora sp. NPDC051300 TaxID=3364286 RepID=UPI00378AE1FB